MHGASGTMPRTPGKKSVSVVTWKSQRLTRESNAISVENTFITVAPRKQVIMTGNFYEKRNK